MVIGQSPKDVALDTLDALYFAARCYSLPNSPFFLEFSLEAFNLFEFKLLIEAGFGQGEKVWVDHGACECV